MISVHVESRAALSLASFHNQRDMHGSRDPTTSLIETIASRSFSLKRRLRHGCNTLPQLHPILQDMDIVSITQRPLHTLSMTKGIANPPYPPVVPRILSHVDKGCQAESAQFQSRFPRHQAPLGGRRHQRKDIRPSQVCSPVDHPLRSSYALDRANQRHVLMLCGVLPRITMPAPACPTTASADSETAVRDSPNRVSSQDAGPAFGSRIEQRPRLDMPQRQRVW